jgi:hypothetical protein
MMLRRRLVMGRRPRLLGVALIGGLGFAAGRASKPSARAQGTAASQNPADPELAVRLKELAELHASGSLTDEEFAAAKAKLLGS